MSGRRVAREAPADPVPAEDLPRAARGDLSGLRADLERSRGSSTVARWPDDGPTWPEGPPAWSGDTPAWQQGTSTLWVEDPVSSPGAPGHGGIDALHPDDLAVLHDLTDAGPETEPAPEPVQRRATLAERREVHRGSADGLSLWSDPEEDAPDHQPARRGTGERAHAPRWAVVLAAVLALLVGAALTALVTEGQVRSARQETAEALSAAEDARESAGQARTALQESEALAALTAPEPRDPEPFDDRASEDGAAAGSPGAARRSTAAPPEERSRETAPGSDPADVGARGAQPAPGPPPSQNPAAPEPAPSAPSRDGSATAGTGTGTGCGDAVGTEDGSGTGGDGVAACP